MSGTWRPGEGGAAQRPPEGFSPPLPLKVKVKVSHRVRLFVTPWTMQYMEFSRPESWSGKPFLSPGDLPNPGIEPRSPILQADSLLAEPQGSP